MGETTTIVRDAAEVPGAALSDLATSVGALTNEAAHHAQTLAAHAEQLTAIEEKHTWLQTQLDSLAHSATTAPAEAITQLRADLEALSQELGGQVAALSEAIIPQTTEEEAQTQAPPEAPNEAPEKKSGLLGGLRKALHRLL